MMKTGAVIYARLFAIAVTCVVPMEVQAMTWRDGIPVDDETDANSSSYVPLSRPLANTDLRYQQVYRANNFAGPHNAGGGVWLERIYFRVDTTNGFLHVDTLADVQVNFSTTPRGPDSLSAVFADNVGADDTVVFGRTPVRYLFDWNIGPGPKAYSEFVTFSHPFFYDPARGNLLLDIRIFQGNTSNSAAPPLDAWDRIDDPVSSLWAPSVNSSSGTLSTVGLVTDFEGQLVPKLSFQQTTNALTLKWTAQPDWFLLQQAGALENGWCWQTLSNGVVQTNFMNTFTIEFNSMPGAFFRLVSIDP